ncbi:MAG: glutamyl-tRNA reductase [Deltaproteobacteria bacterium]|jgi:glutamyl-tRNA reductase|nr:glutamyl-tRNA reductase [Deltaproteobacteria bacterium]
MDIVMVGVSHRAAPVAIREKLAEGLDVSSIFGLMTEGIVREGLVISTCNRLEVVVATDVPGPAEAVINDRMAGAAGLKVETILPFVHRLHNLEAVEYLFRVTAGLDSQVLGEAQILGQVKEAYRRAVTFRTVGPVVSKLFHKSFQTAKRVRSETEVTSGTVSIASAAVETAQAFLGSLSGRTAMVVGTGEMASLAAGHLKSRGVGRLAITGRSLERAGQLAQKFGAQAVDFQDYPKHLAEIDLLVVAVAAPAPIVTADTIPEGIKKLMVVDLGVPRNVDPQVGARTGVTLRNVDDFKTIVTQNQSLRRLEAEKAGGIIQEEVLKFSQWLLSLATSPTIKDLIKLAEEARAMEVERTVTKAGFSPEQVEAVEAMSRAMVRRLLHNPLDFLKSCHRHGRADYYLNMFRRVFGLDG